MWETIRHPSIDDCRCEIHCKLRRRTFPLKQNHDVKLFYTLESKPSNGATNESYDRSSGDCRTGVSFLGSTHSSNALNKAYMLFSNQSCPTEHEGIVFSCRVSMLCAKTPKSRQHSLHRQVAKQYYSVSEKVYMSRRAPVKKTTVAPTERLACWNWIHFMHVLRAPLQLQSKHGSCVNASDPKWFAAQRKRIHGRMLCIENAHYVSSRSCILKRIDQLLRDIVFVASNRNIKIRAQKSWANLFRLIVPV